MQSTYELLAKTLALIFGAMIALGGGVFLLLYVSFACIDEPWLRDSPEIARSEAAELKTTIDDLYLAGPKAFDMYTLPRPLRVVDVHKRSATILVGSEYTLGNGKYNIAWFEIFNKYHPGSKKSCVRLTVEWPGGAETSQCCDASL